MLNLPVLGLGLSNSFSNLWRFGFSVRLIEGDAFPQLQSWFERLKTIEDLGYQELQSRMEDMYRELDNHPNPILRIAPFELFDRF